MPPRVRQGRPRHNPETAPETSPRAQVLDAAAALFAEHGFAATSTRMIAERVGIRQASLYYHFAGKDELLIELLTTSVLPSLEAAVSIEALVENGASPAAALYRLATVDVDTLATTPHNIGTLYLLPEVQNERYELFRADRRQLQAAYGRLGRRVASAGVADSLSETQLGELLMQVTEIVIQIRRDREPDERDADAIASSCLRLCGLADEAVAEARRAAAELLAGV